MKYLGYYWQGFKNAIACFVGILLGILLCALFDSCASSKHAKTDTVQIDSTRVEVRTETVYVPDTVFINIPPQSAERRTADSTSHLETDYAVSDAKINSDGTLSHSLENKPQDKPVAFQKPVERKDSTVYRDRIKTETVTETVEVERQLSWWEQTRIFGFYAALILIAYTYRKKIFKLIVRVFA